MPVTGRPLVALGMIKSPAKPAYPVTVSVPVLVVKVHLACTKAGNANSNRSGSSTLKRVFIAHSDFQEKASSAVFHVGIVLFWWRFTRRLFKQIAREAYFRVLGAWAERRFLNRLRARG